MTHVDAGGWGATYAADEAGKLHQVGLGPDGHRVEPATAIRWYPEAYPTWGDSDPLRTAALRVTHHDGTLSTRLRVESIDQSPRDDDHNGQHTTIRCRDDIFDLVLTHHFLTHPSSGVLEQWVEVRNDEPGTVRLGDYDSIALNLLAGTDTTITQFGGSGWADEWRWNTQQLQAGTVSLTSLGGAQPHLGRAPFMLLDTGGGSAGSTVVGFSIQWMGNTRFDLDLVPSADPDAPGSLSLRAGANPYAAEFVLEPGAKFVTPAIAWTWSIQGRADVTDRFHRWTRDVVLRDPEHLRPIVVNNWEATGMGFDEGQLVDLIERAGELDADLFLLDDGWFGTTHARNDDTQGLGDWTPDPTKLPSGFAPLVDAAKRSGLRFGTWVEPEMVNPASELHEAHPEWILRDRREPREHRQQLVLDPLIDEVRGFEAQVFDSLLDDNPGISYLKWDANRPITEAGSTTLGPDRQSNVWVDYVRATWKLMDDVIKAHPDTELMLCASGGGRNDHGTLRRFHEFWTSDNTDPVTRVRMQWACSHFFPASVMAAHVTRWGQRPVEFACAVALFGRFGFDIDLCTLTDTEFDICARAVAFARRNARVIQHGDIEHIISPVEGNDLSRAAVAFHSGNDQTASHHPDDHPPGHRTGSVLFAYQLEESPGPAARDPGPRIHLGGLDAALTYELTCSDLRSDQPLSVTTLSGAALADDGIEWPLTTPCTARVWEIRSLDDDPGT